MQNVSTRSNNAKRLLPGEEDHLDQNLELRVPPKTADTSTDSLHCLTISFFFNPRYRCTSHYTNTVFQQVDSTKDCFAESVAATEVSFVLKGFLINLKCPNDTNNTIVCPPASAKHCIFYYLQTQWQQKSITPVYCQVVKSCGSLGGIACFIIRKISRLICGDCVRWGGSQKSSWDY